MTYNTQPLAIEVSGDLVLRVALPLADDDADQLSPILESLAIDEVIELTKRLKPTATT